MRPPFAFSKDRWMALEGLEFEYGSGSGASCGDEIEKNE